MLLPDDELATLTLRPDNPSNCVLTLPGGKPAYTVITEHSKKATITQVRNKQDEIIAYSEWRDVLPDKVTIGEKKPMSLNDWMKRSMVPFKDDISFTDDQGRKYKWKGNSAGRSFELFCADDNYTAVIACFNRSRRTLSNPSQTTTEPAASTASLSPTLVDSQVTWSPATLVLTPRAAEIQDTVVTSFLFLEKTRRINEKEQMSRADVLGTPPISVGAEYRATNGGV